MCTVLLPPGVNPIAVTRKYIISYHHVPYECYILVITGSWSQKKITRKILDGP